jgi:hypothetical protein
VTRTVHCGLSVRGALRWNKREFRRMLKSMHKADGTPFRDIEELREALFDLLSQGHEMLPFGEPCEGWSPKDGCPGHAT